MDPPPRRRSPRNRGNTNSNTFSSSSNSNNTSNNNNNTAAAAAAAASKTETKLKIKIKRYHGVAKWSWGVNGSNHDDDDDEDEVCIVCQSAFEGCAPNVKYPGDESPVVFGRCGHAFHLKCVSTWLQSQNSGTPTCPTCRQEWEFGVRKVEENGDGVRSITL